MQEKDLTILNKLKMLVESHFVRTFLQKREESDTLTELPDSPLVSVCRLSGRKTFDVDRAWLMDLCQRVDTLATADVSVAVLAEVDFKEAISTASEISFCLWSALRSHWGFAQIFSEYDKEGLNLASVIDTALWYVPMCGKEQQFIPFLKYQLAYLFAKGEKQDELPERPGFMHHKDGLCMVGSLGRAFYIRALGEKKSSQEWRNTVLHGIKKGLPQMGSFHLVKNIKAMKARLTRESRTPSFLKDEISRTAREIFPKGLTFDSWSGSDMFTKISDHACYEKSRSSRGALGLMRDIDFLSGSGDFGSITYQHLGFDRLLCMGYDPHRAKVLELRIPSWTPEHIYAQLQRFATFGQVGQSFATRYLDGILSESCTDSRLDPEKRCSKDGPFETQLNDGEIRGCWLGPLGPHGKAKVKPIFEPLKVRMISAGDTFSNCVYSRLQQRLWSGLQRFQQFALTGRGVQISDMKEIHERTNQVLGRYQMSQWVSGDYSAATDNLNGDASRTAVDALSGDPITQKVLLKGLQNTVISFDSIRESLEKEGDSAAAEVPDDFVMTNGQLMGCVFSFPILCIVNFAVYRASLEAFTGRRYKISDLPVLVNGDDIAFKTNQDHYKIWCEYISEVGFEKSIGKNYVSDKFCVINSQYFDTRTFEKVPFLNLGWCTGVTKGSGGKFEAGEDGEEKTILGLKAKVERTESDWGSETEFGVSLTPKDRERRGEICQRFKDEILRWNWDRITRTSVSIGPGPTGLGLSPLKDKKEWAWTFYLYLHRQDKKVMQGLSSHPRTLVPWKFVKTDDEPSAFWAERVCFERILRRSTVEAVLFKYQTEYFDKVLERIADDLLFNKRISLGTYS